MKNYLKTINKGLIAAAVAVASVSTGLAQDYQPNNSFLFKDNGDLMMKRGTSESVWKRAMVSYIQPEGSELVLNFANDYPAGTRISSKLSVIDEIYLNATEPLLQINCGDYSANGAKMRMTEAGSKRGAFLHYNSNDNEFNIGISNESGGQYSDINALTISRSSGDIVVNTPFTINNNDQFGHARLNLNRSNDTRIAAVSFGEGTNYRWHSGLLYNYGALSQNFYICQEDYVKNASTSPDFRVPEFTITTSGNVGIGVLSPDSRLVVDGRIKCEEIRVEIVDGADYVFDDSYELMPLSEIKTYVDANKHLPNIPSAKDMEKGVDLSEFNNKLLEKIEELTLYTIQQQSEIAELKKMCNELAESQKEVVDKQ